MASDGNWELDLIDYYSRAYNYYEKTEEEISELRSMRDKLKESMPDYYKTGVHIIRPGCCFMGEDLAMIDGHWDHNVHARCGTCNSPTVFRREHPDPKREPYWCTTCKDYCTANFTY